MFADMWVVYMCHKSFYVVIPNFIFEFVRHQFSTSCALCTQLRTQSLKLTQLTIQLHDVGLGNSHIVSIFKYMQQYNAPRTGEEKSSRQETIVLKSYSVLFSSESSKQWHCEQRVHCYVEYLSISRSINFIRYSFLPDFVRFHCTLLTSRDLLFSFV